MNASFLLVDDCPEERYLNKFVRDTICGDTNNPGVWRDLGIILIKQESVLALKEIEIDNRGNVKECCSKMFSLWLQRQPKANWSQLINALEEVKLYALADNIKKSLLPSIEQQHVKDMQRMQELDTGMYIHTYVTVVSV